MQPVPKPSTVAGPENVKEQPKRSESTQNFPLKKSKGKRVLLNSKEIADFLGFFTSGPSPAETSQKF
ncbi:unnamed protein product [Amaranthus hypochondriacus]